MKSSIENIKAFDAIEPFAGEVLTSREARASLVNAALGEADEQVVRWLFDEQDELSQRFGCHKCVISSSPSAYPRPMIDRIFLNPRLKNARGSKIDVLKYLHSDRKIPFDRHILHFTSPCHDGDLESLEYLVSGGASLFFEANLRASIKSQSLGCVKFLLSRLASADTYVLELLLLALGLENVDVAKYFGSFSLLRRRLATLDRAALMAAALESPNPAMWDLAIVDFGGELTTACYSAALKRGSAEKIAEAWSWLKARGCPLDSRKVFQTAIKIDAVPFAFVCDAEGLKVENEDIYELCRYVKPFEVYYSKKFEKPFYRILEYILLKNRTDFLINRTFLQEFLDELITDEKLDLLRRVRYQFTKEDLLFILDGLKFVGDYKIQKHSRRMLLKKIVSRNPKLFNKDLFEAVGRLNDDALREYAFDLFVRLGLKPDRSLFNIDGEGFMLGNVLGLI